MTVQELWQLTSLRRLSLGNCCDLSGAGVVAVAAHASCLSRLELQNLSLRDSHLVSLVKVCS